MSDGRWIILAKSLPRISGEPDCRERLSDITLHPGPFPLLGKLLLLISRFFLTFDRHRLLLTVLKD